MKVLIIHYHLIPGGVTSVIKEQIKALADKGIKTKVMTGFVPEGTYVDHVIVPELMYDSQYNEIKKNKIINAIRKEIKELSKGDDVIVHVHNPLLNKNANLPPALFELAQDNIKMLFQIHDFGEDWRPSSYVSSPYPENVFWSAINKSDVDALKNAGTTKVYFLPNCIPIANNIFTIDENANHVIYPVRGIRRKNIGEALLLSMFISKGTRLAITLPPNNERDIPSYQFWKDAASQMNLPVDFEYGVTRTFDEVYRSAKCVVTTSIKEGFGLSFMEPLARGRKTLGRRINKVVKDFEEQGIDFSKLYNSIYVDSDYFDEAAFRFRIEFVISDALKKMKFTTKPVSTAKIFSRKIIEFNDYGRLDEPAQKEVLDYLDKNSKAKERFIEKNSFLKDWDYIQTNKLKKENISFWSLENYSKRLIDIYNDMLVSLGGSAPSKQKLLESFIKPETFYGVGI